MIAFVAEIGFGESPISIIKGSKKNCSRKFTTGVHVAFCDEQYFKNCLAVK